MYNFSIDTTNVQVISNNNFNSYTFIVERAGANENMLENYMLTIFENGDYSQMLLKYPYAINENGIEYNFSDATAEYLVDNDLFLNEFSNSPCPTQSQEILEWQDNGCVAVHCGLEGDHAPGEQCEDGVERSYWDCDVGWVVVGCVQTNTGGGSSSGPFGSPSGGGSNQEGTFDNEIPVIPFTQTSLEQIIECMNSLNLYNQGLLLSDEMISWLENNRQATSDINKYLQDNTCSDEAKEIALFGIDKLMDEGEANFEDLIFKDDSFKDSNLDCIHKKLMESNNFYSEMINKFYDNNGTVISYEIGDVEAGEWGNTKVSFDNFREMTVTFSQEVDNLSNLSKKVTLSHEMIHVYMFNTLEEWEFINIDVNGNAVLSINCPDGINYSNINLNTLSIKARFVAILCAFSEAGALSSNWTHELFGLWTFDTSTYVEKLKDFLLQNHDWDNENEQFKNEAITIFGQLNWKEEVAKAASWIGLEGTAEYINYIDSYTTQPLKFVYITDIKFKLQNAKTDCL
jgi:hypothetical protein